MRHLSGYGAYKLFLALRTHFQSEKYDIIKFQGKVKASQEAYQRRHDKFFFEKLAKRYDAMELRDFYIANIIEGNLYVTDMMGEDAHGHFMTHQGYKQSLSYKFGEDLEKIYFYGVTRTFKWHKGEYPRLLTLYMQHEISLETLVILFGLTPAYRNKFDKYLGKNDTLWSVIRLQVDKMKPFVQFDKDKMVSILREKLVDRQEQTPKEVPTKEKTY